MNKSISSGLAAILMLSGCVSTYKNEAIKKSNVRLEPSKSVLIATPQNGSYDGAVYANSGSATATAVRSAFMRHTNTVDISTRCKDVSCLQSASNGKYDYLVVPVILHWEDRATEWSGIKDKLEFKIIVYSSSGEELSSNLIYGKSKWATFGGDHPQDLLPEPTQLFVDSLY